MSSGESVKNEIVLEETSNTETTKEQETASNPIVVLLKNVTILIDLAITRGTFTANAEEATLVNNTFDNFKQKLDSLNSEGATVDIKINSLIDMKVLIDTAVRRGKYQPTELFTVGSVYNAFMELIQKASQSAEQQQIAADAQTASVEKEEAKEDN